LACYFRSVIPAAASAPAIPKTAAASAPAAGSASPATARSTPASARFLRPRLIDYQRPPHHFFAVQHLDSAVSLRIIVDFDEPKPSRFVRKFIAHERNRIRRDARLLKEIR
jgi:hypothetical protein